MFALLSNVVGDAHDIIHECIIVAGRGGHCAVRHAQELVASRIGSHKALAAYRAFQRVLRGRRGRGLEENASRRLAIDAGLAESVATGQNAVRGFHANGTGEWVVLPCNGQFELAVFLLEDATLGFGLGM